jgi:pilus assembly protein TadC
MALHFWHWKSKIKILLKDVQELSVGEFDKRKACIYFYSFYTMLFNVFWAYLSLLEVIFMSWHT